MVGKMVVTKYDDRIYTVTDVDFTQSPSSFTNKVVTDPSSNRLQQTK